MDRVRFDDLARRLGRPLQRRSLMLGLASSAMGLTIPSVAGIAAKDKRRKKRPRFNQYGCLDVGQKCHGKDARCCSGICQGKRDRSRCVAHGASTCQAGQRDFDICGGAANVSCTTSTGETNGGCNTTTGNAPYCIAEAYGYPCQKDADCRSLCGEAAACILCTGAPQGTACASPTAGLCQFPDRRWPPADLTTANGRTQSPGGIIS